MSAYPVTIKKQSGRAHSSSGGKDYHLILIQTSRNNSITIFRWGKKDAWGVGFEVKRHNSRDGAESAYRAKFAEKLGGEFKDHFVDKQVICHNEDGLKKALGPYFFKMKPEDLEWLVPGIDTSGAKEQKAVVFEQRRDGSFAATEERKLVEEAVEPVAARILENPAWGTW
jgi:hypothetical protein